MINASGVALRFFKPRDECCRNERVGVALRAYRCGKHDDRRDEDQYQCGDCAGHWDPDHAAESLEDGFASAAGFASVAAFASAAGVASDVLDDSLLELFAGRESVA